VDLLAWMIRVKAFNRRLDYFSRLGREEHFFIVFVIFQTKIRGRGSIFNIFAYARRPEGVG
jgi:hypothetical protein